MTQAAEAGFGDEVSNGELDVQFQLHGWFRVWNVTSKSDILSFFALKTHV